MLQAEGQWLGFLPAPFLPSSLFSFPLSFSFSKHSHAHMCNSRILSWGVKMQPQGTFLEIQCLILTPNAGSPIPGQGPKTHMLQLRAHRWQIQLRPSAAKKKKLKRDSAPTHMSLTVQWAVTDQKQSDTPPHSEVLQTPLHPQLKQQ